MEVEATAWSAALRRCSRGPVTTTKCHGWMLEFDGDSWASSRAVVTRCCGIGVERNRRLECLALIASSRLSPLDDSTGSTADIFLVVILV